MSVCCLVGLAGHCNEQETLIDIYLERRDLLLLILTLPRRCASPSRPGPAAN